MLATMDVTASGRDVPAATMVNPMISSLTPRYGEIIIALSTNHVEPRMSNPKLLSNC